MMKLARGFCDLNISATDTDLRQTVLKALSVGYQTLALNRHVTDNSTAAAGGGGGKKKKKGDFSSVPPPPKLALTPDELRRHGITRPPVILTRLTVTYANPDSPFLAKHKEVIRQYDLLALTPTSDKALKQTVTQSAVEVDIIALSLEERGTRFARKLLRMAKDRNMYFELSYGPCLSEGRSRQQTIALAHSLHQSLRSANIIVSSGAHLPSQVRQPYDVINLGRFFGLTEAGSKAALASTAHNLVYCAAMRRTGVAKCAAQVTLLKVGAEEEEEEEEGRRVGGGKGVKRKRLESKFEGLEDARKYLKAGCA
ncbi:ribonuclease P protein subunit p30-like [Eriocheir sinensis]|uniref:ribonuclease P protein subunit p30-like n=1 Tax=Eriocheir sinensis TaxID=95602 RepID=UPI0021C81998|nr:ribonuclease P protein subunit p30-like [Eriocheir sinensis]